MGKFSNKASFKPGWRGGPGRPKSPVEILEARKLNKTESERIINKFLNKSLVELAEFANDKSNNVHELLVARIMFEAIKNGDEKKLEWIYSRLIGNVKSEIEVNHKAELEVMIEKWKNLDPVEHIAMIKEKNNKDVED